MDIETNNKIPNIYVYAKQDYVQSMHLWNKIYFLMFVLHSSNSFKNKNIYQQTIS